VPPGFCDQRRRFSFCLLRKQVAVCDVSPNPFSFIFCALAFFLGCRDMWDERPSQGPEFRQDHGVFCPLDLVAKGTWVGTHPASGAFAALTNIGGRGGTGPLSRGTITLHLISALGASGLQDLKSLEQYTSTLNPGVVAQSQGFNMAWCKDVFANKVLESFDDFPIQFLLNVSLFPEFPGFRYKFHTVPTVTLDILSQNEKMRALKLGLSSLVSPSVFLRGSTKSVRGMLAMFRNVLVFQLLQ